MPHSRREFIKFVVAGSVAAGCPLDSSLLAAALPESAHKPPLLNGEHFEICHSLRDGKRYERPPATKKAAVVIVGGGVAGLSAAYFLRDEDFLLLEKEDHFGGNAYQEEFEGQPYATGSAFALQGDHGDLLARMLGMKLLPVKNPDATIVNGAWVPDTWRSGIDQLPYSKEVRESFKKFRDAMLKINVRERFRELDAESFLRYTEGYAPEITRWWDAYGPSNWGAAAADSSALVGISTVQAIVGDQEDPRVILPGGLGVITRKLVEVLQPRYGGRMLGNATVVAVVPDKRDVRVTYFHEGKLTTVEAKAVLMCTPKMINQFLVTGLPAGQRDAIRRFVYAPYAVVNLIFDKPVYNRGYDTWCPGNTFTDFIVADWTVRDQPGYKQKHNILTCYTPLRPEFRAKLWTEDGCQRLASQVLDDFQQLLPEFNADPIEVRIYRRGHPMFMSIPQQYTKNRLAAAQPLDRIYFGNADSGGPESATSEAIRLSQAGAEWARLVLAGKPGAKTLALEALTAPPDL